MALLDDFNRADGALGANWSQINVGSGLPTISGNKAASTDTAERCAGWNAQSFTADQEVSYAISGGGSGGHAYLFLNVTGFFPTNITGYLCDFSMSSATAATMTIFRAINASYTNLGGSGTLTYAAGDVLRMRKSGAVLSFAINGTIVFSVTDPSPLVASNVFVGFGIRSLASVRVEDFSGGAFSAAKFGASTLTITDSITTVGTAKRFGSSTLTETVSIVTAAIAKRFGSSTLTETVSIDTLGKRVLHGASTLTETVQINTVAKKNALAQSSLVVTVTITTFISREMLRLRPVSPDSIALDPVSNDGFVLIPVGDGSLVLDPA